MPPAIRGVRATYFAKSVPPEDLSRVGQLASTAGLVGGVLAPCNSAIAATLFGDDSHERDELARWFDGFRACALFSFVACAICAVALWVWIPAKTRARRNGPDGKGHADASSESQRCECERCRKVLTKEEKEYAMALCDLCYDSYSGTNYNFRRFRRNVLVSFCIIASLLEVSMNACIIASFQPIAVTHFHWGSKHIAAVLFSGAGLSVAVSWISIRLRLLERVQIAFAAGLYLVGVLMFTIPPLVEWRCVVGMLLGIKAQILFMSPWTAVFSKLIGSVRVTNRQTMWLCMAPAIGGAAGTALSPLCVVVAGTYAFPLATLPSAAAGLGIVLGWGRLTDGGYRSGGGSRGDLEQQGGLLKRATISRRASR